MKIRASQIGRIMSSPRSKSEKLSQTTKSYILELAIEHKYGIVKEFWESVPALAPNACNRFQVNLVLTVD